MLVKADFLIFYLAWITMAQAFAQEEKEKEKPGVNDLLSRIDLDEMMKKEEPPLIFPNTLEEFGYAFNEEGQLRHIKTGERFVFNYKEDMHRWNQKRYEALGEIITQYVYERLEKDCKLRKVMLPVDAMDDEPKSFFYMSEDALTNPDKLLVLIQGSGVVRAGQWARRLIINEDLNSGTQIPFITRAMEEGYGVMVLNPNENVLEVDKVENAPEPQAEASDEPVEKRERKDEQEGKKKKDHGKYRNAQMEKEKERIPIRENSSPEEHTLYVWDYFISRSVAKNLFVVAHSYGGLSFVELMITREEEVLPRVCAVAMTDSVHNVWHQYASSSIQEWLKKRCCNWVSSPEPLDTPVGPMLHDCIRLSAGTEKHELTSWSSFHSVFNFLNQHLQQYMEEDKNEAMSEEEKHDDGEKVGQEKVGQEKVGQEKVGQEKVGQEKVGQEEVGQEKVGQEKVDQEKVDQEKVDQEKVDQEKVDQEKTDQEKTDQEKAAKSSPNQAYNEEL